MSIYVDSSAFLKLYFDEPDSGRAEEVLSADPTWVTARHTAVEVRRNLSRELRAAELAAARRQFARDWQNTAVVELTSGVCEAAARGSRISDSSRTASCSPPARSGSFATLRLR